MKIVDLMELQAEGYEKRNVNVFFQNDLFKAVVIVLEVVRQGTAASNSGFIRRRFMP
ncbi:MAG: hypothetical protein U5N56_13495 [Candidatus Marinimicrobia bacterium]|nr:hypothetical protein [Candidatus Neomarinimicrobiota bacterium]